MKLLHFSFVRRPFLRTITVCFGLLLFGMTFSTSVSPNNQKALALASPLSLSLSSSLMPNNNYYLRQHQHQQSVGIGLTPLLSQPNGLASVGMISSSQTSMPASQPVLFRPSDPNLIIPNRYIVVLKGNIPDQPDNIAKSYAIQEPRYHLHLRDVYASTIKGFTADIPDPNTFNNILKDPRVAFVEQDRIVKASFFEQQQQQHQQSRVAFIPAMGQQRSSQVIPTGVSRVHSPHTLVESGTRLNSNYNYNYYYNYNNPQIYYPISSRSGYINNNNNPSINSDIAILDTSIDLTHPDLNVYNQISFVNGTTSANDDNGHGTLVAGISAAKNNGIGVVGVAPGARLWDVKVLDSQGNGLISDIIKGVDYVTGHADQIDVVNLSFGCSDCYSPALDSAIQNSISKGIVYVAAAGNDHTDVIHYSPADFNNVIAVSAMVDTDGKCGGLGPSTQYGPDDSLASFSNFGQRISMAAPGVNILSTDLGGNYATISGTSASTPHVSGAAALVKAFYPRASATEVKNILSNTGTKPGTPCNAYTSGGSSSINYNSNSNNHNIVLSRTASSNAYFTGDTDRFSEPLLHLADGINNILLPSQRSGLVPLSNLLQSNLLSMLNREWLSFPTGSLGQQILAQMPMLLSQPFPKSSIQVPTDMNNLIDSSKSVIVTNPAQSTPMHICDQINTYANHLSGLQNGFNKGVDQSARIMYDIHQRLNAVLELRQQSGC